MSELALAALAAIVVVLGAVGLLYLLRPLASPWPGPVVHDALPLDQLAGQDGVRLFAYVLVWAGAGLALGTLAFAARVERLTAGILAALLTGGLLYAATGISIYVVEQIHARSAFHQAGRTPAVYLAAAFAGLGAAALGRRNEAGGSRTPLILGGFVALSGVLDFASALVPADLSRLDTIEAVTPTIVPHVARALVVPTGLALVVLARGLRRRRRRAWQLTTALVVVAAVLHILKGLDYAAAIANILLATALIARRHDFEGRGDPEARKPLAGRLVVYAATILLYGIVALWINRLAIDRPFTVAYALEETGLSAVGAHLRGSDHLSGDFGAWFSLSVFLLAVSAGLSLLWAWLAPWRLRTAGRERDRLRAHSIVSRFGTDTLAPFTLRADKSYFFDPEKSAFLAYTVVAGVAVVSGDPVGPEGRAEPLLRRFIEHARARDWRIGVLGAGERHLELYRELGLRVLYHGDEAIVDPRTFSLDGRAIRKVRQSVTRLERQGFRTEARYANELSRRERAELQAVSDAWRGEEPERGFTMELDTLFRLGGRDALFVVGRDGSNAIKGFLHFVFVGRSTLSLSSMRRSLGTPNGFNEWLVVEAIRWAGENEVVRVSLNFAPFAAVFSDEDADAGKKLLRGALETLKFHFQLDNLLAFNRKFQPAWEPRYIVYEGLGDLPRVGIAGLAAEGYLALPGRRR